MAGVVLAHSLLQGGPGFPVLHPGIIYAHLSIKMVDAEAIIEHPCAEDLPLNAATLDTRDLINKVGQLTY